MKTTSDPDLVNMVASIKDLGEGLKVPCLTKCKSLQPETLLLQASKDLLKSEQAGGSSKKRKTA